MHRFLPLRSHHPIVIHLQPKPSSTLYQAHLFFSKRQSFPPKQKTSRGGRQKRARRKRRTRSVTVMRFPHDLHNRPPLYALASVSTPLPSSFIQANRRKSKRKPKKEKLIPTHHDLFGKCNCSMPTFVMKML